MAPAPPQQESVSTSGIPAGYGRSCTSCSRAKCRCILRAEGGKCDRCHRLGKECQQMVTARKRVAKRTTASRTAQLEEKLDDLVSILRATQQQQQQPTPATLKVSPTYESASSSTSCGQFLSRLDSLADAATTSQPQHRHLILGHVSNLKDTDKLPEPTPSEAEDYLIKFREWLQFFPFFHLSPDLTAEVLQRERPFLWLCIMNITSLSIPQQHSLRDRIRQEVAQRVVVNHERSMDLLLGLVAYVAWATLNSGPGSKPFLALYTQMANCIVAELSLAKFPNEEHYSTVCFKAWGGRAPPQQKERTMEERRAVLALWFTTSLCSSFLGKLDPITWSPHMQESLEVLEAEKEYPADDIFVFIIKIQLVGEEARKLVATDMLGREYSEYVGEVPTYVHKRGLVSRLQAIRQQLPPQLAAQSMIQTQLLSVESQVHAVGLFGIAKMPDTFRVESMYSAISAAKSWHDTLFSIPLTDIPGLPFHVYIQLSQLHALLYRLTVIEDPMWDKEIIRNTADLLAYLDRAIDMFMKAEVLYPLRCEVDDMTVFAKCVKILRNVRTSWEPVLSQHLGGLPTPNSQVMPRSETPQQHLMIDHSMMADQGLPPDFNDLSWMTEVFGPWDT